MGYFMCMAGRWWRCDPRYVTDGDLAHLTGLSRAEFDRLAWLLEPLWEEERARRVEGERAAKRLVRRNAVGAGKPPLPFRSRLFVVLVVLRTNMPYRTVEAQYGVGKDLVSRSTRQLVELLGGLGVAGPGGEPLDGPGLERLLRAMAGPGAGNGPGGGQDEAGGEDGGGDGGGAGGPGGGVAAGEGPCRGSGAGGEERDGDSLEGASGGVIVDGTYTRVGRPRAWLAQKELYSSHRGCHCLVYQACCDLDGNLLWLSEPFPGSTHDLAALERTPLAALLASTNAPVLFDKGYQGAVDRFGLRAGRVFLPRRKPPKRALSDGDKDFNRFVASLRVKIEHVNEKIKNWKVLGYYRGRRDRFGAVLQAVAVLATLHNRMKMPA